MGRVLEDIGLCTFSLLIKFIAFNANVLASKNTTSETNQQMDSTTCLVLMQGYASMKIQRIVWEPHGVSGSYIKDFVMGRQLTKSLKKSSKF